MQTFALQSGSAGNAFYVEADGVRLLFDAGVSGRHAKRRLMDYGRRIHEVDALIISHDHSDHVRHAGAWNRLFRMPVYCTKPTYDAVQRQCGRIGDLRHFRAGETLCFGEGRIRVLTIPTPHDAVDGVCFVVESSAARLGIFTDLGHPFLDLHAALRNVDAAYLESNYDPQMLANGTYPAWLQDRIRGERGHLSNVEAAQLLSGRERSLRWVVLAHLSEENNTPEVALDTHRRVLGSAYPLYVAPRHAPTSMLAV